MSMSLFHTPAMSAAPTVYNDDGTVSWGTMWGSFCELASEDGPAHRGEMLLASTQDDPHNPAYQAACVEIARGIKLVTGLTAIHDSTGWMAVICDSAKQAAWLAEQILYERVQATSGFHLGLSAKNLLYLPVGSHFTVENEVKSVITVVAKTMHYYNLVQLRDLCQQEMSEADE